MTSNNVIDQAKIETSLGHGIGIDIVDADTIEESLDNKDKLEQDVCSTFQTYGDNFEVDQVDEVGKTMDDVGVVMDVVGIGIGLGVGFRADVDIDVGAAGDSSTLEADDRDVENNKDNDEGDDDADRSPCCRCIV